MDFAPDGPVESRPLLREKIGDDRAKAIHVDQEGVVPLHRIKDRELYGDVGGLKGVSQGALLMKGKQRIGGHANDLNRLHERLRENRR